MVWLSCAALGLVLVLSSFGFALVLVWAWVWCCSQLGFVHKLCGTMFAGCSKIVLSPRPSAQFWQMHALDMYKIVLSPRRRAHVCLNSRSRLGAVHIFSTNKASYITASEPPFCIYIYISDRRCPSYTMILYYTSVTLDYTMIGHLIS